MSEVDLMTLNPSETQSQKINPEDAQHPMPHPRKYAFLKYNFLIAKAFVGKGKHKCISVCL